MFLDNLKCILMREQLQLQLHTVMVILSGLYLGMLSEISINQLINIDQVQA